MEAILGPSSFASTSGDLADRLERASIWFEKRRAGTGIVRSISFATKLVPSDIDDDIDDDGDDA